MMLELRHLQNCLLPELWVSVFQYSGQHIELEHLTWSTRNQITGEHLTAHCVVNKNVI